MSGATGDALVRARKLTKRFGSFTAVDAVDFDVRPAEAFGFLGPNGAGKTSTMRMIACASPVSDGELAVIGMNPASQARFEAEYGRPMPPKLTWDAEGERLLEFRYNTSARFERELREFVDANETPVAVHQLRGEALRMRGDFEDALKSFQKVLPHVEHDLSLLMGMAWCFKRIGRLDKAIDTMKQLEAQLLMRRYEGFINR